MNNKIRALNHYTALAREAGCRMFRCRIARMNDGFVQTLTYIGPADGIPAGWSVVMRKPVLRAVS